MNEFCPISCSLADLDREIDRTKNELKREFLRGVQHARIVSSAALNRPELATLRQNLKAKGISK